MRVFFTIYFALALLLGLSISPTSADSPKENPDLPLQCFNCTVVKDPKDCYKKKIIPCPGDNAVCMKINQEIFDAEPEPYKEDEFKQIGRRALERTCTTQSICAQKQKKIKIKSMEITCCNSKLCNF